MIISSEEKFARAMAALQAGKLNDAEKHFKELLRHQPQHIAALNILSVVLTRLEKYGEAEPYIKAALKLNASSDASFYNYGIILKALHRPAEALAAFDRALSINSAVAETWNNRGTVLNDLRRYDAAVADFSKAISLAQNYAEAFSNKAKSLAELRRYHEALAAYDKALALRPDLADAWLGRGSVCGKLERYDEAFAAYDKALSLKPDLAEGWLGRGNIFGAAKRYDEALAAYDKALSLRTDFAEVWLGRGNVYLALSRYGEAQAAYDKALSLKAELAGAWVGRGDVLGNLKRYDEAGEAYDKALKLDAGSAVAWLSRGNLYCALNHYDDAGKAFNKALALQPDYAEVWVGRGNILNGLRRYEDAIEAYKKARALKPDLTEAWHNSASALQKLQKYREAAECYETLLKLAPDYKYVKGQLLHVRMHNCDWASFAALTSSIDNDLAAGKPAAEPFGYQAVAKSAQDFQRCAELYAASRYPLAPKPMWQGEKYNNAKIRIGYLSGEFRAHITSLLMARLFELHDKSRFEVFAFDAGWDDRSEVRGRLNKAFDEIVDISKLDDRQAAAAIREKQIDVLVNLNGYFGEERTGIFSHRPAPVAVNYLGFSATMGTPAIDYIVADKFIIPAEQKTFYTEKVATLPDSFQVNDDLRLEVGEAPSRAAAGLPETGFVFCCFNNSFKITPEIFGAWMRILSAVEGSVLWVLENNQTVAANLREEARRCNIAPERIIFAGRTKEHSDYLARYKAADLFLDTSPFNAGATASDALWAGLPLLTYSGEQYTARMAGSLLHAIGLGELATPSLAEYEAMAIKLAREPALLASIKTKLANNRKTSPLFNTARFTRHIEAAFTTMVARTRRGEPPESFAVEPIA